jgi:hypothetical protein
MGHSFIYRGSVKPVRDCYKTTSEAQSKRAETLKVSALLLFFEMRYSMTSVTVVEDVREEELLSVPVRVRS